MSKIGKFFQSVFYHKTQQKNNSENTNKTSTNPIIKKEKQNSSAYETANKCISSIAKGLINIQQKKSNTPQSTKSVYKFSVSKLSEFRKPLDLESIDNSKLSELKTLLMTESFDKILISEFKTHDKKTIYQCFGDENAKLHKFYSLEGQELFDITERNDGTYSRTIYSENGDVEKIVEFSEEGKILDIQILTQKIEAEKKLPPEMPEFIYHITSYENYKSMQKCGYIDTTSDRYLVKAGEKAIFTTDLDNLITKWNTASKYGDNSLLLKLLKFCDKNKSNDLVIIKIPTKKLNPNNFTFREAYEALGYLNLQNQNDKYNDDYMKFFRKKLLNDKNWDYADEVFDRENISRVSKGIDIEEIGNYISQTPIEILYKDKIPMDITSVSKPFDISEIIDKPLYDEKTEKYAINLIKNTLNGIQ